MKINLLTLGLIIIMAGTVSAGTSGDKDEKDQTLEYKDYLKTSMFIKEIEEILSDDGQVRIMNSKEIIVLQGKNTDEKIKEYMCISDLLTEVDGVKYYRLSYK
jgi:hypothetical protein